MTIDIFLNEPHAIEGIGMIPCMLDEDDPRPAAEQFHQNYAHGGGWHPINGFKLEDENGLQYPGDPPLRPIAGFWLHDELILIYPHALVLIMQPDGDFEVSRMD